MPLRLWQAFVILAVIMQVAIQAVHLLIHVHQIGANIIIATFYGFMMCFLPSTSLGTLYHYLLGREAPYGYFELPVLLGTVGGVILCIGTAGLWHEKRRMDKAVKSWRTLGMDYAFIWLLFWVSATGLIPTCGKRNKLYGAGARHPFGSCLWFFPHLAILKICAWHLQVCCFARRCR